MKDHLFVSSTDGALYDTRVVDWHKKRPLRCVFDRASPDIVTCEQLKAALRHGQYAWPGGYPMYFIAADGGALSFKSVRENLREVLWAIQTKDRHSGWRVVACDVNYEDGELFCVHSGERIESAYAEPKTDAQTA